VPATRPRPAAPITIPIITPGPNPLSGRTSWSRSRNATNISKNPLRNHGPQLARSANATGPGIRVRSRPRRDLLPSRPRQDSSPSPSLESTAGGSRIAQTVATTNRAVA
jgi:hypothetical protein